MTKTLQDYITESEVWVNSPAVGDDFAINIREECLVESHIVDVVEDGIVLQADDRMMEILESYGLLEAADPYRREISPPSPEEFEEGVAEGWNDHLDDPDDYEDHIEKLRDLADIKRKEKKENPPIDKDQGVAEGVNKNDDKFYVVSGQGIEHGPFDTKEQANAKKAKASAHGYKVVTGKQAKKLFNEGLAGRVDSPVSTAITRRILNQRPDLLKYGPEAVMAAIDEVAEWVGDVEEIGSSDVSAWVAQVARYLQTRDGQGIAESQAELSRIQELAGMPPMAMPAVNEGGMKRKIDDLYYDFKQTTDIAPDISDDDYLALAAEWLQKQGIDRDHVEDIGEMFIDMRDHEEDDDHDYANDVDAEQYDDEDMMEGAAPEIDYDSLEVDGIDTSDYPDFADAYFASGQYQDGTPIPDDVLDDLTRDGELLDRYITRQIYEAEYQGREVPLGKPFLTPDGPKKRSVYVKNPKGNIVKVNFGDKTMRIKKSNPKRRKNFRARHNCANPGPRHKARYWSCRAW